MRFITSLEYTLKNGLPQEKLALVRQCVEKIWIDSGQKKIKIRFYTIPACNIKQTMECIQEI
ncbi:MAG: hypothetical protein ACYSSI_11050 [Planctomycetota bacterium]|jgi:hypothetical protein